MFGFNSNERRIAKLNRTQEGFTWLDNLSTTEIVKKYSEEIALEQYGMSMLFHGALYEKLQWEKEIEGDIQKVNEDPPGNLRTQMLSILQLRLEQCNAEKLNYALLLWEIHNNYWNYYLNTHGTKKSYNCYEDAMKNVLKRDPSKTEFIKEILIGKYNLSIAPENFMKKACEAMDNITINNIVNKKTICDQNGHYGEKKNRLPIFNDIKEFINIMGISIPEEVFHKFL